MGELQNREAVFRHVERNRASIAAVGAASRRRQKKGRWRKKAGLS